MLFNSIDFAIFLPIVFTLYWLVTNKNHHLQNFLIATASLVFYGWWDWRFLFLLSISAIVDYVLAIQIDKSNSSVKRKIFLTLSIATNLGILFFFKYFNFFIESFFTAFHFFGYTFSPFSLKIILPVGISFYIFKTLSYTIDVSRLKLKPTRNIIDYFAFLSFFPQILAGPIDRAANLLPQFNSKRIFSYHVAVDGLKQILWGLFKKLVIADNCARIVNNIFENSATYPGSTLVIGALLFTVQIYTDFSGYSDIAIGTTRLFGFESMRNFAYPYFSRNIVEFWRRWHISLTSWFTDYVFSPLSIKLRNMGKTGTGAALFFTFLLCGLWHGANLTFIVWGALNAMYFIPFLFLKRKKNVATFFTKSSSLPSFKEALQITITFSLTVFAWIFFRAESLGQAMEYISKIFSHSIITRPDFPGMHKAIILLFFILVFFIIEWLGREHQYAISDLGIKWYKPLRWAMYYLIIVTIFWFAGSEQQFIYFQF